MGTSLETGSRPPQPLGIFLLLIRNRNVAQEVRMERENPSCLLRNPDQKMLISASPGSPDVDSYRNDSPRGPDSTFQTPALGTVYSKASSRFTLHSWPRQGIPKVMLTLASWRAGSLVACGGQVSPDLCPLPPVLGTCLEASTPAWLTSSTRPGWRP